MDLGVGKSFYVVEQGISLKRGKIEYKGLRGLINEGYLNLEGSDPDVFYYHLEQSKNRHPRHTLKRMQSFL